MTRAISEIAELVEIYTKPCSKLIGLTPPKLHLWGWDRDVYGPGRAMNILSIMAGQVTSSLKSYQYTFVFWKVYPLIMMQTERIAHLQN